MRERARRRRGATGRPRGGGAGGRSAGARGRADRRSSGTRTWEDGPSRGASTPGRAGHSSLAARSAAREGRQAFAEARRRERRLEALAHVGHLAAAERPLAVEQGVALCVQALAGEREVALTLRELQLEPAKLGLALGVGVLSGTAELAGLGLDLTCSGLERLALPFELDPHGGELFLNLPRRLLALLEPLPLGRGELAIGLRFGSLRSRGLELAREYAFPLLHLARFGLELCLPLRQLGLPRLERPRPFEGGALPGRERFGGGRIGLRLLRGLDLRRLASFERALQLVELALA